MSSTASYRSDQPATAHVPTLTVGSPSLADASAVEAVAIDSPGTGWGRLRGALSTLIVVTLLVGLFVWGHRTGWALPKFSELMGATAPPNDWCFEHNVPEKQCIECNAKLLPPEKDYGWCEEHGIPCCPLHHPEVAQLDKTPKITPEDFATASRALVMAPRPVNLKQCKLQQKRIQFADRSAVDKAGVECDKVQRRPLVEALTANGEVVYDQTKTAHLASRVTGSVWRVEKQVGDRVRQGEVLALIDSADVGRAKSELLQSISRLRLEQDNVRRLKPLASDGVIAGRRIAEAESAAEEARIHLLSAQQTLANLDLPVPTDQWAELPVDQIAEEIRLLGLPPELIAKLGKQTVTSNLYPLRSSLEGVVVERKVSPGEVVDAHTAIFDVADLGRMWLNLAVRQEDVGSVSVGQKVLFRPGENRQGAEIAGKVGWVSTSADDATRMVRVRVELPNNDSRLRANTFGTGRIVLREEPAAIFVPTQALHWDGCCHVVFVRDKDYFHEGSPKYFHVRKVRTGVKDGELTEVIVGLLPGEFVAYKNSVVLEAQLLKGNLGAGCGCCH